MRDDKVLIEDIIEAIDNIERYTTKGRRYFDENELVQVWFIHYIQGN